MFSYKIIVHTDDYVNYVDLGITDKITVGNDIFDVSINVFVIALFIPDKDGHPAIDFI